MGEKEPGTGAAGVATQWIRQNVLGLVAIFIALSGTALATNVASDHAAQVAKSKRGPRGPAGPPGPAGSQGLQGVKGDAGSPDTGTDILGKLAPVDGSGSGLDSDMLDGQDSTAFATRGTEAWNLIAPHLSADFFCAGTIGRFCGVVTDCQWQNQGGSSIGAYLRDPLGFVHLRGIVETNAACVNDIFFLPAGYRPAATEAFAVSSSDAFGTVYVDSSGDVVLHAGSPNVWVALDGLSFRCEPSGSNGCP